MTELSSEKVVSRWLAKNPGRSKTAGEVRFVKDNANEWGWKGGNPEERLGDESFTYNVNKIKPLAETLRATTMALGHVQSAYATFTKLKSSTISPDGNLGGRGYIQKIPDMRRSFMNCSEALSSIMDTLHDELHSPHWDPKSIPSSRERDEVVGIFKDIKNVKEDPEAWAEKEEEEESNEQDY